MVAGIMLTARAFYCAGFHFRAGGGASVALCVREQSERAAMSGLCDDTASGQKGFLRSVSPPSLHAQGCPPRRTSRVGENFPAAATSRSRFAADVGGDGDIENKTPVDVPLARLVFRQYVHEKRVIVLRMDR